MAEERSLIDRISAVRAEVKPLVLDENNPHGKYRYASIDQIYDMLRPILAKHELDIRLDFVSFETDRVPNKQGGESVWGRFEARLWLACPEEAEDPVTRHLFLPVTGAQSFGSADSYLTKAFARQRFFLATGDEDPEATAPQEAVPETKKQIPPNGQWVPGEEDGAYAWDGEGEPNEAAWRQLYHDLAVAMQPRNWTRDELAAAHRVATANRGWIGKLPDAGRNKIEQMWKELPELETGEVA